MSKQKSLVTLSVFVMSAFLMLATRNFVQAVSNNAKVTICHATSSVTNPYTTNVVSENAIGGHFNNPGSPKAGHELDLYVQGEVDCPVGTNPTATPTNVPTATPTTPVQCDGECYPNPTATPTVTPTPTQGNVDEGNIYDPCVLNRCPSATPTATPTATLTPTSTPAPTSSQGGTGGSSDGGSNNNSSSSSSSNNGSVQGATTTLAATGVFEDMFMNLVGLAGVALSGLSAVMYAKKS